MARRPSRGTAVAERPRWWARLGPGWLVLLVAFLVILFHWPLLRGDYVQDDHLAVESNPVVARGDVAEIFFTSYWEGAQGEDRTLYRPIAILSYALEQRLTGEAVPAVSRLVNLLLHVLVAVVLFALLRRCGSDWFAATATTVLFALLPVHLEAVANAVGRAELLAALFSLLALLALSFSGGWWPSAPDGSGRRRAASWTAAAMLFCALLSKEIALATPLLMLALELLFRPAPRGRDRAWWIDRLTALAPSVLAGLLYLILRVEALEQLLSVQQPHPSDNPLITLAGAERVATALSLLPRYVVLLLFPWSLSADYSGPAIPLQPGLLAPAPLAGLLLLGIGLVVGLPRRLRPWTAEFGHPGPVTGRDRAAFGAMMFFLPYLVISNLFFPVGTIFGERLIYLPSVGFCMLLGGLLGAFVSGFPSLQLPPLEHRVRLALLVLALFCASSGLRSWARALEWRNDETLFRAAIRSQPLAPRPYFIVGKIEADQGQIDLALARFDSTIDLYPEWVSAWHEKGVVLAGVGRFEEALEALREAVRLSPQWGQARVNLALALRHLGRSAGARREVRKALLASPSSARGWAELGNLELERGHGAAAARAYRRAIELGRTDLAPRLRLAERRAGETSAPPRGPSDEVR